MDRHSIREDATSVDTASYGVGDMEFWHGKRSQGIIKINLLMPNAQCPMPYFQDRSIDEHEQLLGFKIDISFDSAFPQRVSIA
ncbi:hypothetical protein VF14_34075 [Nostoc linckia z18]|jgi:hypothetical protein|uniref:Uncharacterized protein n=2 Tax=Nostoc linckia TaxID=92942 RepID=A0A9Q5Z559_NOSLI|nr:hypothetical protein [Nostoc linckia]PHK30455.1 hypothetical protein VF12_29555 [Nostoc linckia z15]PHK39963.1 hypothetical protein VF13_33620 [Nostoc linckia z16]PHJ57118.1 hypothetical protein VF03_36875 [Nostoc linckia z2]PHJ64293.1 hypothetical protein VF02_12880 [Nostoc linckia z1]PHJ70965.1 hypothetical protein VF05_09225 [Nostoc linckia z3]